MSSNGNDAVKYSNSTFTRNLLARSVNRIWNQLKKFGAFFWRFPITSTICPTIGSVWVYIVATKIMKVTLQQVLVLKKVCQCDSQMEHRWCSRPTNGATWVVHGKFLHVDLKLQPQENFEFRGCEIKFYAVLLHWYRRNWVTSCSYQKEISHMAALLEYVDLMLSDWPSPSPYLFTKESHETLVNLLSMPLALYFKGNISIGSKLFLLCNIILGVGVGNSLSQRALKLVLKFSCLARYSM